MKRYTYSNDYETYTILQMNGEWIIEQDGVWADRHYPTLKAAKKAIDNQEVYF